VGSKGHRLECSHYEPDVWLQPVRVAKRLGRDSASGAPLQVNAGQPLCLTRTRCGLQALPCVVFLHGNSGCRVDAFDAVRVLLPLNFTVFTLDFAGSGLSEGCVHALGTAG
jgi:hypothetical protein